MPKMSEPQRRLDYFQIGKKKKKSLSGKLGFEFPAHGEAQGGRLLRGDRLQYRLEGKERAPRLSHNGYTLYYKWAPCFTLHGTPAIKPATCFRSVSCPLNDLAHLGHVITEASALTVGVEYHPVIARRLARTAVIRCVCNVTAAVGCVCVCQIQSFSLRCRVSGAASMHFGIDWSLCSSTGVMTVAESRLCGSVCTRSLRLTFNLPPVCRHKDADIHGLPLE